jgi:hypothetical protein
VGLRVWGLGFLGERLFRAVCIMWLIACWLWKGCLSNCVQATYSCSMYYRIDSEATDNTIGHRKTSDIHTHDASAACLTRK